MWKREPIYSKRLRHILPPSATPMPTYCQQTGSTLYRDGVPEILLQRRNRKSGVATLRRQGHTLSRTNCETISKAMTMSRRYPTDGYYPTGIGFPRCRSGEAASAAVSGEPTEAMAASICLPGGSLNFTDRLEVGMPVVMHY